MVLLESETAGFGASGRNGGFCVASLTHGIENGPARFASEMNVLERLGLENFDALAADLVAHGIDWDFEPNGELVARTGDDQLEWSSEGPSPLARYGYEAVPFDAAGMQAEVTSPTYVGALWLKTGAAILDPGPTRAVALRRRPVHPEAPRRVRPA